MDTTTSTTPTQKCPQCGTPLDATGVAPGAWLRCPRCGRPVEFRPPPPPPRPKRQPQPAQAPTKTPAVERATIAQPPPPTVAPAAPPRPAAVGQPANVHAPAQPQQAWMPRPRRSVRGIGCLPLGVISGLAGCAFLFFQAVYFGATNGRDLFGAWVFGTLMALFIAKLTTSIGSPSGWE